MTRLERLAVLAALLALVALLVVRQPVAAGLGALAGLALGLAVAERTARLRRRLAVGLGADAPVPPSGLRPQVVVRRVLLQVCVLAGLLVVAAFTPLVGDSVYAAVATAATTLPAVLTAHRLRG